MLPYDICVALKAKGFPQGHGNYWVGDSVWDETAQSDYETPRTPPRDTWVYSPTLEELIEACGESFIGLDRNDAGWTAHAIVGIDAPRFRYHHALSMSEAVANLYLAITK